MAAFEPGAGMEHLGLVEVRRIEGIERVAGARGAGVARGRHHHPERGARIPARFDLVEAAVDRGFQQVDQVRLQAQHHRLGFRIAEAHVEFDHPRRAGLVDHQPGVEEPGERHSVGGHAAHGGHHDLAHHPLVHLRRHHRRGRVGAHAAGVGPGVAVADALVVLRGRHRQRVRAVDHGNEAGLLAVEEFLDHHSRAGVAEGVALEHVADRGFGLRQRRRHHHALARGQAIGLDHDRRAPAFTGAAAHVGERGVDVGMHLVEPGGNAVAFEELLGEGLAAFQLRGRGGGAEDAVAAGAERIDHAGDQRLLGADHGQGDAFAFGQRQQAVDVGGLHVRVAALVLVRGAGVAGGDDHLVHAWGLRQLPRQRVLASAGTDDEEFHGCARCGWEVPPSTWRGCAPGTGDSGGSWRVNGGRRKTRPPPVRPRAADALLAGGGTRTRVNA